MIIYLVTYSNWDDHEVDSAWTQREDAQARVDQLASPRYGIEEFTLDSLELDG